MKSIDSEQLLELARLHCTQQEAAAVLGCSQQTLSDRLQREPFKSLWEKGQAEGKVSLRRAMLKAALGGSAADRIFLSKQPAWLGFSDRIEKKTELLSNVNVTWTACWGRDHDEIEAAANPFLEGTAEDLDDD